jgi:hypothetical protein
MQFWYPTEAPQPKNKFVEPAILAGVIAVVTSAVVDLVDVLVSCVGPSVGLVLTLFAYNYLFFVVSGGLLSGLVAGAVWYFAADWLSKRLGRRAAIAALIVATVVLNVCILLIETHGRQVCTPP